MARGALASATLLTTTVICALLAGCGAFERNQAAKSEPAPAPFVAESSAGPTRFPGTWRIVQVAGAPSPLPLAVDDTVVFSDKRLHVRNGFPGCYVLYQIHPDTPHLNFLGYEDHRGAKRHIHREGLFLLEGDRLTIAYGETRPESYAASESTSVVVLERVADK